MGTVRWTGAAQAIAQINTVTPANVNIGNTFTITINNKSVTFTATAGTVANVTAGLVALFNASEDPEFTGITATDSTTHVTLTADTAGIPFTQTSSASGGTATNITATTTAATGPNFVSNAANYDTGSKPVNSDDFVVENTAVSILYDLDDLSAVTLATMRVMRSFTGTIGLPNTNSAGYPEYRDTYLQVGITALTVGEGDGQGSGRIKIDLGSVQNATEVVKTGNALESGIPSLLIKGTNTSNTLNVQEGSVGGAFFGGDAYALASAINVKGDVRLVGATQLTTVSNRGGKFYSRVNATTINNSGGTYTHDGSATVTTLNATGGKVLYKSTGTATNVNIGNGPSRAIVDCSDDAASRTWTNTTIYRNGQIDDPNETVTHTNDVVRASGVKKLVAS